MQFKFLKKRKYVKEETKQNKMTKKKDKKSFFRQELNPRSWTWKGKVLSIVPQKLMLNTHIKLILLMKFCQ